MNSIKMKLMCGVTAVSVLFGSVAMPVTTWAADGDDDLVDDLVDLDDEELEVIEQIIDVDGDGDVDERDAVAVAAVVVAERMAQEADREHEENLRKQAELDAQRLAAQRQAETDARKRAELEAQLKAEKEKNKRRVTGISVSTTDVTLNPGQTYQITAYVKPDDAKDRGVSFSSNNNYVASIDASGVIHAYNTGTCVITARTNENGYQARTYVHVNAAPAVAAQTMAQDANWTNSAAAMILAAAPGSVVNLVAPKAMSFDAAMINALKARPDVGLLIAYPYAGHTYLMSVPAGYNLTAKKDTNGKVSFVSMAAVKDGKVAVTMVK